ncbi:MAG: hypothetical protein R3A44_13055 [Caldilineaceae bacterium]
MVSEMVVEKIATRPIYNLEFPSRCPELNIFGYRFLRVRNYEEKVCGLQHLVTMHSEFSIQANTGGHAHTANVEFQKKEELAVLEWSGSDNSALMDVLLLLSIFTGRDVFAKETRNTAIDDNEDANVIVADSRVYKWGGILRCSIPYKKQPVEPESLGYNIGFEDGINDIYGLIRSDAWQEKYAKGYFLFLAKMAFHWQTLEAAFIQCWTIWEHLFTVLNQKWLSNRQIRQLSSVEKISFLLVNYALAGNINDSSRKRIETLAEIRNRLIHFGRFPERGSVRDDAVLFIRLTEFIIAKILDLSPSNVFDTIDRLENFLSNIQKS